MRALVVVSVVVVSSVLMGCPPPPCEGSNCTDAGSVAPVPTPQTGPEACAAVRNAELDFYARCGAATADYIAYRRMGVPAQCSTIATSASLLASTPSCVQKWRSGACTDFITCPPVAGSGGAGASCYETSDCLADLYCDERTSCPGTCTPRVPLGETVDQFDQECVAGGYAYGGVCRAYVAEGASCATLSGGFYTQSCQEGLVCTAAEVCTKTTYYAGLNEPCSSQRYCGAGLRCVGATCVKRLTAGGLCGGAEDCVFGLACVAGKCEPHIGKAGDACENATSRYCATGLFCNRPTQTGVGTCAPLRSTGAACDDGTQCADGLFCAATGGPDGECRTKVTVGGGCAESAVCGKDLYCEANRCTFKKSAGASCTSGDECLNTCSGGACTQPNCYQP